VESDCNGASKRTLTKEDLARAVYSSCLGLSRHKAKALVGQVLDEIASVLTTGEDVTLYNFGKFAVLEKRERAGRNPKTGATAVVSARRSVVFKASPHLKATVAGE
jgi:integration host factor subunit alpha